MQYPVLDKRLSAVAEWVRPGSVLADVGTDHGYLAANLVGRGICPCAYGCDIASGPLERARATVARCGLGDKITLMLSDGLTALPEHCAQDIVIAGMGGELIAAIIDAVPWVRDGAVRLILQPMTRARTLRRYLYQNGYGIVGEHGVCESRHCYTVLCAAYTGEAVAQPDELAVALGGLPHSTRADSAEYVRRELARQRRKLEGLAASAAPQRRLFKLREEIDGIKRTLRFMQDKI